MALKDDINNLPSSLLENTVNHLNHHRTIHAALKDHVPRVEALEAMNGVSPQSPVDGQTASLISQDDTLTRQALDATYVTPIPDTTVTVGPGGTYATINDAISELSKLLPTHQAGPNNRDGGSRVIILLKSGFVMAEQVFVHRINLGWITIQAEDHPVPVSRAALTVKDYQGTNAAFYGHEGATLPVIDCLFSMDTSGVADTQSGITLDRGSFLIIKSSGNPEKRNGFINVAYRGLNVHDGSRASISWSDFSGAGNVGIRIANASLCQAVQVKATDCGSMSASVGGAHANFDRADLSGSPIGIRAGGGATVSAAGGTIVNSCGYGLYATDASSIAAHQLTANDCTTSGLFALNGARIDAAHASVDRSGSHGIHATNAGVINANSASANNSGGTGVLADFSGMVNFNAGEATGCNVGVSAQVGGRVVAIRATLTGASTTGALINAGGWADLSSADLTGSASGGIRCFDGSFTHASNANARKGVSDDSKDVEVRTGSTINAQGLVGGISQEPNVLTASGVIYRLP